ncbi:phosphatase PAP2 family protein [Paenibacillus lignilyticus]|uniref:Phosphatase PAP2 family protein n=1 Tax=Paenibacillus lignilyticus TaxID=1172615 RepID=A0ABS5CFZ6_9BACL|nr:phosphatase PAP2 family protein [Paenibacillus lignilyticus]MBP3964791.1 phosphatase PAP2 family protein [Paenibacillus lignilyticus]
MWLILLILAIAGFQGLSMLVSRDKLKQFDETIISAVQGQENDTLTSIAKVFNKIGSTSTMIPLVLIIAVLFFFVFKHRKELVLLLGGMLGSTLLNELLKPIYKRARPDIHRLVEQQGFSYPSGNAMAALTFYCLITYLLWRHIHRRSWRIALLCFSAAMILIMGVSRIYLGVHYPSDILAGFWLSACWVALCIRLFRSWARTNK